MSSEHQLQGHLTRHDAEIAKILTRLNGNGKPSILSALEGGTGLSSYVTGDLLYASSASALARLADVATGNALISGGVGVAPSYGKIGLTTHVSGVLPVANGGTATSTQFTLGSMLFALASGVYGQDNANLFYDNVNKRFGLGTASPQRLFHLHATSTPILQMTDATTGATGDDGLLIYQAGVNTTFENSEAGSMSFRTSGTPRVEITSLGNVVLGSQSALATTATDGFAYIPTCAGVPTGVPTGYTGKVPMVYDTTNSRLYIRVGGAWVIH